MEKITIKASDITENKEKQEALARTRQVCIYVRVSKDEYENGFDTDVVLDEMKAGTRGFSIEDDGVD